MHAYQFVPSLATMAVWRSEIACPSVSEPPLTYRSPLDDLWIVHTPPAEVTKMSVPPMSPSGRVTAAADVQYTVCMGRTTERVVVLLLMLVKAPEWRVGLTLALVQRTQRQGRNQTEVRGLN
jgi:hypothetical protein